ncbi:hypothetical protein [Hymenobacter cheonanensis]|uniref:hypothetical protein n=1 Tax=Hymenobacter sp. CA2-7 TaxID=3063993 RepID=UPI0027143850|nr:hypothetical protein [Hymenobacter sp. CA2-7]MDO7885483.1 hypothetical protein [Hymenobacter sp. CA2-7]
MKKLLSYLAPAAVVLLASCSSEPSDWRPDKKVSLDMIEPGTRPSDNFDQGTPAAPSQEKGGAISRPVNSGAVLDRRAAPSASAVMTADTQEGTAEKPGSSAKPKKSTGDSATPDTAQGQAGARRQ